MGLQALLPDNVICFIGHMPFKVNNAWSPKLAQHICRISLHLHVQAMHSREVAQQHASLAQLPVHASPGS
jgi:hypothetical protein